jgi:hypothetical protein
MRACVLALFLSRQACTVQVKGVMDDFEGKVTAALATSNNLKLKPKVTEMTRDEPVKPAGIEGAPSK